VESGGASFRGGPKGPSPVSIATMFEVEVPERPFLYVPRTTVIMDSGPSFA
jgi:hypothetical protein